MGGMGMIVTALASAQEKTGIVQPAVVMPYYSFLKKRYRPHKVVDLTIDIRDKEGNLVPVEFRVWKTYHIVESTNIATTVVEDGVDTNVTETKTTQFPVYLIGPGNRRPFSLAFRAKNTIGIYSTPEGLPQEWKDQFFSKAVAEFLTHQATANDEISLFAPPERTRRHVDIVHLHGATNAYVAKFLRDYEKDQQLGPRPPAIVYTMHDYLDELQYTNTYNNVFKFLEKNDTDIEQYRRGNRVFMSSLGIDDADVVTFVSKTMAADIVEGRLEMYLKELVMKSILRKAEQARFFGITNGVDFGSLNPFTNKRLKSRHLLFPDHAWQLLQNQTDSTQWKMSLSPKDYVTSAKEKAKKYLVRRGRLEERDIQRPLVLFVGRFQYNKGLEMFDEAVQHFVQHDMKFVIIGQPNNYPLEWVKALQARYPEHVVVMSTDREQRDWLVTFRAAADFVFVPSLTESFGLVAAEGLLFGSPVISTGAGGLKEFLVDRPTRHSQSTRHVQVARDSDTGVPVVTSQETYNAFLFERGVNMGQAIQDAAQDYQKNKKSRPRREEYNLRMIRSAFALGWARDNHQGPVYDYLKAYELALHDHKGNAKNPSYHV